MEKNTFQWPPLESDPSIFNKYFHTIGMSDMFVFEEILSLDYKEIQFIQYPVLGIIVAIKRPQGKYCIEENIINPDAVPFYMKQTSKLDNACGLVAALHCIGSTGDLMQFPEETILKKYYDKAKEANAEERAKLLEDYDDFKQVHHSFAKEGQSSVPTEQKQINHHYVAFVNINGNLIELDGTLKGPVIIKKNVTPDSLLDDTIEELRKRLGMGVIAENLAMLYLTYQE